MIFIPFFYAAGTHLAAAFALVNYAISYRTRVEGLVLTALADACMLATAMLFMLACVLTVGAA